MTKLFLVVLIFFSGIFYIWNGVVNENGLATVEGTMLITISWMIVISERIERVNRRLNLLEKINEKEINSQRKN